MVMEVIKDSHPNPQLSLPATVIRRLGLEDERRVTIGRYWTRQDHDPGGSEPLNDGYAGHRHCGCADWERELRGTRQPSVMLRTALRPSGDAAIVCRNAGYTAFLRKQSY